MDTISVTYDQQRKEVDHAVLATPSQSAAVTPSSDLSVSQTIVHDIMVERYLSHLFLQGQRIWFCSILTKVFLFVVSKGESQR